MDKAVDWGYLTQSPADRIKRYKEKSKGQRSLSENECRIVLASATPWQQEIIKVGIWTGMRKCELLGLRFSKINLSERYLIARGKYGKERRIDICPPLAETFQYLLEYYPNRKFGSNRKKDMVEYLPRQPHQMDFVFCREDGKPMKSFDSLSKLFKKLGLEKVSLHSLRKTFCSLLAKKNVHPKVAQQLMGHASSELTMKVYTEIHNEQCVEAVERLPDIRTRLSGKSFREGAPLS